MVKNLPADSGVQFLGREDPRGEGDGNPFQYSCLENSVDRGAWRAAVRGVPAHSWGTGTRNSLYVYTIIILPCFCMYYFHCYSFMSVCLCSHSPTYAGFFFFFWCRSFLRILECFWSLWSFSWRFPSYFKDCTSVVTIINRASLFSVLVFPHSSWGSGIMGVP